MLREAGPENSTTVAEKELVVQTGAEDSSLKDVLDQCQEERETSQPEASSTKADAKDEMLEADGELAIEAEEKDSTPKLIKETTII